MLEKMSNSVKGLRIWVLSNEGVGRQQLLDEAIVSSLVKSSGMTSVAEFYFTKREFVHGTTLSY